MNKELTAFGERLRAAREALDLSLDEVEHLTRIRAKFLQAFEDGQPDPSLSDAQIRGFLRNYARTLKLDPEETLSAYLQAQMGDQKKGWFNSKSEPVPPIAATVTTQKSARSYATATLSEEVAQSSSVRTLLILMAGLFFVALILIGGLLLFGQFNTNTVKDNDPLLNPPLQVSITEEMPIVETPTITPEPLTPTPTTGGFVAPPPDGGSPVNVIQGLAMDIEAESRSWVQITVDGQLVLRGLLRPGEKRHFDANDSIALLTGNAGGLKVTINGQEVGTLGGQGEFYERTFTSVELNTPIIPPTSTPAANSSAPGGADFVPTPAVSPLPTIPPLVDQSGTPLEPVTGLPLPTTETPVPPTATPTFTATASPTEVNLPERITRTPRP